MTGRIGTVELFHPRHLEEIDSRMRARMLANKLRFLHPLLSFFFLSFANMLSREENGTHVTRTRTHTHKILHPLYRSLKPLWSCTLTSISTDTVHVCIEDAHVKLVLFFVRPAPYCPLIYSRRFSRDQPRRKTENRSLHLWALVLPPCRLLHHIWCFPLDC